MKNVFYPFYYDEFKCIGGVCKHNCCIGWEIDIDPDTYKKYQKISGALSERLKANISTEDTPHFVLQQEERCPFLNEDNLCDIILEKGENFLCQICSDHPRFRNFFAHCTEVGLGLCCEEAARLILSQKEPFFMPEKPIDLLTAEEISFFRFRNNIFKKISDRTVPFSERIASLCQGYGISFPKKSHREWADVFLTFEHMDDDWISLLKSLKQAEGVASPGREWDMVLEQLFSYFIYRHLSGGLEDGRYGERILFATLGTLMISFLASVKKHITGVLTIESFIELARLYSSEIEYSEDNTEALLELMEDTF
ncbi:MAG: flagellin lysine-N-methylase [Clostridia bacterium]|nr:flagellin lysine-N-methylase [Clostridia bacterium]